MMLKVPPAQCDAELKKLGTRRGGAENPPDRHRNKRTAEAPMLPSQVVGSLDCQRLQMDLHWAFGSLSSWKK